MQALNLQRLRELLTLVLIGLLPLHALLVTIITKLMVGAGQSPHSLVVLWKEALLGLILGLALIEICRNNTLDTKLSILEGRSGPSKACRWQLDRLDKIIIALILISGPVSWFNQVGLVQFMFGFKYDFVPLVAFLCLRRVPWSEQFTARVIGVLLAVGVLVATYGIFTLFLPMRFFTWLGYSDLHSLYVPNSALAAFQQIGGSGIRRVQSTLSGPNQFGLWLLIPWGLGLSMFFRCWLNQPSLLMRWRDDDSDVRRCLKPTLYCVLVGVGILVSFSRSAWIAAAVMAVVLTVNSLPGQIRHRHLVRVSALLMFGFLIVLLISPQAVVRLASTRDHALKTWQGISTMVRSPWGRGLGVAGPASNRLSDACVHLADGSDADWATDRPNLCVFVGDQQIQPAGRTCMCPQVTENWYVQIGVELGLLGFALFVALTLVVISRLENHSPYFLPFLSLSIASLFLHAWEGSAVAYSLWVLVATNLKIGISE